MDYILKHIIILIILFSSIDINAQVRLKQMEKGTAQYQVPVTDASYYQEYQLFSDLLTQYNAYQTLSLDSTNRVFTLSISDGNSVKWLDQSGGSSEWTMDNTYNAIFPNLSSTKVLIGSTNAGTDANYDFNVIGSSYLNGRSVFKTGTSSFGFGSQYDLHSTDGSGNDWWYTPGFSVASNNLNWTLNGGVAASIAIDDINYWDKHSLGVYYNGGVGIGGIPSSSYKLQVQGGAYLLGDVKLGNVTLNNSNQYLLARNSTTLEIERVDKSTLGGSYDWDIYGVDNFSGETVTNGSQIKFDGTGNVTCSYNTSTNTMTINGSSSGSSYWTGTGSDIYNNNTGDVLINTTVNNSGDDLQVSGDAWISGKLRDGSNTYGTAGQVYASQGAYNDTKYQSLTLGLNGDNLALYVGSTNVDNQSLGGLNQNFGKMHNYIEYSLINTSQYQKVNLTNTDFNIGAINASTANDRFTVQSSGYYEITASYTTRSTGGTSRIHSVFRYGGSIYSKLYYKQTESNMDNLTMTDIRHFNTGDYVELMINSNLPGVTVYIDEIEFNIKKL